MSPGTLFRFSRRLIRAQWKRNMLVCGGIFLGSFFLAAFSGFTGGLRQNVLEPIRTNLAAEMLLVSEKPPVLNGIFQPLAFFRDQSQNGISAERVQEISALPQVATAHEEIRIPFPVATSADLILGIEFQLDSTISGFSAAAVEEFLPAEQTFSGAEAVLPVLISPLLIEIYNATIVEMVPGAVRKTPEDFLGRQLTFTFGASNYLNILYDFPEDIPPQTRRAEIVGFAPFLPPFTLALPDSVARAVRSTFEEIPAEQIRPRSLLVRPQQPEAILSLKNELESRNFLVRDLSANFETARALFAGLQGVLFLAAGAIFLLAVLFFATTVALTVQEHRQTIGIFQVLGASKTNIVLLFLFQGLLIAGSGLLLGFALALLGGNVLNQITAANLPSFALTTPQLFYFAPGTTATLFGIVLGVTALAAFFPARAAARLQPLSALRPL